jgi:hypothetical protein
MWILSSYYCQPAIIQVLWMPTLAAKDIYNFFYLELFVHVFTTFSDYLTSFFSVISAYYLDPWAGVLYCRPRVPIVVEPPNTMQEKQEVTVSYCPTLFISCIVGCLCQRPHRFWLVPTYTISFFISSFIFVVKFRIYAWSVCIILDATFLDFCLVVPAVGRFSGLVWGAINIV